MSQTHTQAKLGREPVVTLRLFLPSAGRAPICAINMRVKHFRFVVLCLSGRIELGVSWARLEKLFSTAITFYGYLCDQREGRRFRERWPDQGRFAVYMVQLWTGQREWTGEW